MLLASESEPPRKRRTSVWEAPNLAVRANLVRPDRSENRGFPPGERREGRTRLATGRPVTCLAEAACAAARKSEPLL